MNKLLPNLLVICCCLPLVLKMASFATLIDVLVLLLEASPPCVHQDGLFCYYWIVASCKGETVQLHVLH